MGDKNTMAATPPPVVIVFYTTGDDEKVENSSAKGSEWFNQRALTLATSPDYVYGVDKTADGTAKLVAAAKAAPSSVLKCRKVYFYGHGTDEGFMIGCFWDRRDPKNILCKSQWSQYLMDPKSPKHSPSNCQDSMDFLDELARHLVPGFEIAFLGCHMGNELVDPIAAYLSGKTLTGKVSGYTHTYVSGLEDKSKEYNAAGQEFSDALEDDTDPDHPKLIKQQHHNKLPPYDKTTNVTA